MKQPVNYAKIIAPVSYYIGSDKLTFTWIEIAKLDELQLQQLPCQQHLTAYPLDEGNIELAVYAIHPVNKFINLINQI